MHLEHAAVVTITSENPDGFKGIDPLKITITVKLCMNRLRPFYDHLDLGIDRWCIVGATSLSGRIRYFLI